MPENDETVEPEDASTLRARLADAERRAAEREAENAALKRGSLFRDAGFDPNDKQHAAFMRGYDGDLTAEAVSAYGADLGVGKAPEPAAAPAPQSVAHDTAALTRIAEAAMGGGNPPPAPDRRQQIIDQMDAASRKGDIRTLDRLAAEWDALPGTRRYAAPKGFDTPT